ncbi:hypothetical protein COBT_001604 [Conglomerata obtusa]
MYSFFILSYTSYIYSSSSDDSCSDNQTEPSNEQKKRARMDVKQTFDDELKCEEGEEEKNIVDDEDHSEEDDYSSEIRQIEYINNNEAYKIVSDFRSCKNGRSIVVFGECKIEFNYIRMDKIIDSSFECGYTYDEEDLTTKSSFKYIEESKKEKFLKRVVTEDFIYDFYSATYVAAQDYELCCEKALEKTLNHANWC